MFNHASSGSGKYCFAALWAIVFVLYSLLALFSERKSYGEESDSFLCARSALSIARNADYAPSRLPGFPLFERILSYTVDPTDARKSKLFIAAISALNILLLFFLFRRMNTPEDISILLCSAVSFFPLYLQYSFVVIDYPLMIFFVLSSALIFPSLEATLFSLVTQSFVSGLFISLAISTRLTSVFFAAALGVVLVFRKTTASRRWCAFFAFCAGTAAIAPVLYRDVYLLYGPHFLSSYPRDGALQGRIIDNGRIFVRFWGGLLGCAAMAAVCWPLVRKVRSTTLLKAWHSVPAGALAFVGFALINMLFYITKPDKISYHMPFVFAGAVVLAIFSAQLTRRRLMLFVAGIAIGNAAVLLPSRTSFLKVVPGPVVEELSSERKQRGMYRMLKSISEDSSARSLFLGYAAVECAPVWFFDSCRICARIFHPTCCAFFWKSATDYEYPAYICKNLVLGSPLHLQTSRGKSAIDSIIDAYAVTRVYISGEATEGMDSVKIADFFKGRCTIRRLPKPDY